MEHNEARRLFKWPNVEGLGFKSFKIENMWYRVWGLQLC
jgi:hypothetical protein